MKQCSKCKELKSLAEFAKDKTKKSGCYSSCKKCKALYTENTKSERAKAKKAYYEKNKESILQRDKERYETNRSKVIEQVATYRENNVEKLKLARQKYYLANIDTIKAKMKKYHQVYKEKYRHVITANDAKRHAAELQRTPKWLSTEDIAKIKSIYLESRKLTEETGVKHNVDHILPLQGKLVSGLHVPENLRVITETENIRKNNTYELE